MQLHQTNGVHARAQALPVRTYPLGAPVVCGFMLAVLVVGMTGCAEREKPPMIRAEITNVYHETTVLDDFTLIYWWEERGETPFLKPHTLQVRECIVETMVPLPDRPDRVSVQTERIPLERIATIAVVLTEAGKKIEIQTRDGNRIEATSGFPRTLRRDPKSGIADHKVFVAGSIAGAEKRKEFKQELNYIRQIRILEPPSPQ